MDIMITDIQFKSSCLKESCIKEMILLLNKVETKHIFKKPIDMILGDIRSPLDPNSDLYNEVYNILRRYKDKFKLSDDQINDLMSIRMVYDKDNNWHPINKLNTNYSDLSILVTDILKGEGGCICKLVEDLKKGHKQFLIDLSNKILDNPEYYYKKYLDGKFDKYIDNNRKNTLVGVENELYGISEIENKLGCKLVYMSSEGSPIDTKLGVDVIMEKNGKPFTVQIKTVSSLMWVNETPCQMSNKNIPSNGGVKYFVRNQFYINENYVDFLVLISGKGENKKMVMLKKYLPVKVKSFNPLVCVPLEVPLKHFPTIKGQGYIDLETIVYKNF